MKSIKEKAHEIGLVYSKHYNPIACKREWCEMAAREGANYVLDAIEECFNPKDDIVKQWGAIATLIEQLKSNQ